MIPRHGLALAGRCCFAGVAKRLLPYALMGGLQATTLGRCGRYLGRRVGCRLSSGLRMYVDNPWEYIQRQIALYGEYEPQMTAVFRSLLEPGDVFFDIGANLGYYALHAAMWGARVHAFEPVPRIASRLEDNIRLNRLGASIVVNRVALSYSAGRASFHVAERDDDGSHSLITGVSARSVEVISVETTTLDEYVASANCGVPALLKIDVEGAESLVLAGAVRTMTSAEPPIVFIETGDRLAESIGSSAGSVVESLERWDYRIYQLLRSGNVLEVGSECISGELADYVAIPMMSGRLQRVMPGDVPGMHTRS